MTKLNFPPTWANPKGYKTPDEISAAFARASSTVKLICGVGDNTAYWVMLDAYDHVQKLPAFRHEIKRAFKVAVSKFEAFYSALLYTDGLRYFHVDDMPEKTRKIFGDITDAEYLEYWQATGMETYAKTLRLVASLAHKYRKSLDEVNVPGANHLGWAMAALAAMELACSMWVNQMSEASKNEGLPIETVRTAFSSFHLREVTDAWRRALLMLCPEIGRSR